MSKSVQMGNSGTGFFTMMSVNGVDLVSVPLVPTMMSGYVPLMALPPTLILIIELAVPPAGGFGEGGVKVAVTSGGNPVTLRVTFWLNKPIEDTVTIAVLDSVVLIVRETGETETAKSAGAIVTIKVTSTDFTIGGLDGSVPVMFSG